MIFVISPAKALDFETPSVTAGASQPAYLGKAAKLITLLRRLSPAQVAELMGLSDRLAALNVARYESWSRPFTSDNAKQAVLAFNGDVYAGLDAASLSKAELDWAQQHVRILSGLYGLLRPLDLIQPYRLEMGSRLENPAGRDLYAYWGDTLGVALDELVAAERAAGADAVLVNLASQEYFKAIRPAQFRGRVVTPVFEDWNGGRYRVIGFHAKRARGLMCRDAIQGHIADVAGLKGFEREGYRYVADASHEDRLVFRRRID